MISSTVVISLILITVIIFTFIGIVYSKGKIQNIDDYLTARGSTGSQRLTATFLASFIGVFILFTPPEAGAIGGIATIIGYAFGAASLYFAFSILSPKVRAYLPEGSTISDYALKRYGSKMYVLTILLSIFYMLVHLIAELTAIAQVAFQMAEVPLVYTALLVGAATMIYTTYGGLKASMFTDAIQMVLIIVLTITVAAGVLYYSGGMGEIIRQTQVNRPDLLDIGNIGGIEYGLTLCIGVFAANLFHQGYWQRIYSGKNDAAIKKSLIACILVVLPIMFITGFIGIASAGLGIGDNPSVALFALVYELFPTGLIIAAFILALVLVMSTVDTLLNAMVATFAIKRKKENKSMLSLQKARWMTVILIIISVIIASRGYSVLTLFLVADLVCAGVFIPLFFGLYSPKLRENTAVLGAVLGVASGVPFFIQNKLFIAFLIPIFVSAGICILGNKFAPLEAAEEMKEMEEMKAL